MNKEERKVGDYTVTQSLYIGDREVVFGENSSSADAQYMCAYYRQNDFLGQYEEVLGGSDYCEIMKIFCERVVAQIESIEQQCANITVEIAPLGIESCLPMTNETNLENQVVVISANSLRPEYRIATEQMQLCTGGFGSHPNSRGNACYCKTLYDGKESRFERFQVLGIVKPECMPQWAKERLAELQPKAADQPKKKVRQNER